MFDHELLLVPITYYIMRYAGSGKADIFVDLQRTFISISSHTFIPHKIVKLGGISDLNQNGEWNTHF